MSSELEQKLVFFGCLFAAIILHEISHGVVALFFGDDTAKKAGRLTLNPIPHIDPFGSIILPAMMTLAGLGAFGWAKPVPVNPSKLRNTRRDMVYVGLAGPITNFVLMAASAVAGRYAYREMAPTAGSLGQLPLVLQLLFWFAYANLLLGTLQPASRATTRRLVARRTRPPRSVVAQLVQVPPVRVPHPVRARVRVRHLHADHPAVPGRAVPVHLRSVSGLRHLVERFFRMLRRGGPSTADDAWALSMLTVGERPLFTGMGPADRRHAIDGARAVGETVPEPFRGDAIEAALVHDVGKRHARLGVVGRSEATMVGWLIRSDARRTALADGRSWPGRVGRYLRHDVVGAREVAAAGGSALAVAWTADHHHARRLAALPASPAVVAALVAADRDF